MKNQIIKPNLKAILKMDHEQLALVSAVTDKSIFVGDAPICGLYARIGRDTVSEREAPESDTFDIRYSRVDDESSDRDGEICFIHIGSKYHGIMLQWSITNGWCNCYSNHNYGKNYASGGTWSGDRANASTVEECLKQRNYITPGNIKQKRSQLTESPALLEALLEYVNTGAK